MTAHRVVRAAALGALGFELLLECLRESLGIRLGVAAEATSATITDARQCAVVVRAAGVRAIVPLG